MPFGPLPAMVVPNALDFSPITNAIQQNRQNDLALNKLAMEQERLGFEREAQPLQIQKLKQQNEAGALENEAAIYKRFGGLAQAMQSEIKTDPARAEQHLRMITADPRMKQMLDSKLPPGWESNHGLVASYIDQIARGWQDPEREALVKAQTEEAKAHAGYYGAQAANEQFKPVPVDSPGVFSGRTGEVREIPGGGAFERTAEKEAAKTAGKAAGTARVALPEVERSAGLMTKHVDELLNHPYLDANIGPLDAWTPTIRGKSQDVLSRINEIQGGAFLKAFETLKGGGQITEAEGAKATAALNRLGNRSQDEKSYRQALVDFKTSVSDLLVIARQRAQVPSLRPPGAPPLPTIQNGPATGDRVVKPNADRLPQPKQAPDGNFYIPDPNRPGKYLRVDQ